MKGIEVTDLSKRYGEFQAVDGISFTVARGEVFGFLGPNGAGKTSTIRILTGLSRATAGSCRILGEEMSPDNKQIRRRMGVVFEEPNLYPRLSGRQNLEFFAALYGVGKARVQQLLDEYELRDAADKAVAHYSKGMRQRLLICRALLNDPELLILDEPSSGLDPVSVELIRGQIRAFSQQGKTVFMSTHSLEEADELCQRVAFINRGRIIAQGKPDELKLRYGQGYVQVDLRPTVSDAEVEQVLREVAPLHWSQTEKIVSITLHLSGAELARQLDQLSALGRILRIHSQEASLREVFQMVMEGSQL